MMRIPSLLEDLAQQVKPQPQGAVMRLAVVSSYTSGSVNLGLKIGGSTTEVIGRFLNYDPVIGDTVQVIQDGLDPVVIGKVGTTGPGLAVPIGMVAMWGNNPPQDWWLCEGQSTSGKPTLANVWGDNVPDLRYMFVRGAGPGMPVGHGGGTDKIQLGPEHLPSHTHPAGNHIHPIGMKRSGDEDAGFGLEAGSTGFAGRVMVDSGNYTTAGTDGYTGPAGGPGAVLDIVPPFYVVTFIVKVA